MDDFDFESIFRSLESIESSEPLGSNEGYQEPCPQNQRPSGRQLAQRIAQVDKLAQEAADIRAENGRLRAHLQNLNESASNVKALYQNQSQQQAELQGKYDELLVSYQKLIKDYEAKNFEADELNAIVNKSRLGPFSYEDLIIKYLYSLLKLKEARGQLRCISDIRLLQMYVNEQNITLPRNVKKALDGEKCEEEQAKSNRATARVGQPENAVPECGKCQKTPVVHKDSGTQHVVATTTQGTQYIGTSTTRGTSTASLIRKFDKSTSTDSPAIDDILYEFKNVLKPMSPIHEDEYATARNTVKPLRGCRTTKNSLSPIPELMRAPLEPPNASHVVQTMSPVRKLQYATETDVLSRLSPIREQEYSAATNLSPLMDCMNENQLVSHPDEAMDTLTTGAKLSSKDTQTRGTCTLLCNVRREVDFINPLATIKRSDSRPPSRQMYDEHIVKEEVTAPRTSLPADMMPSISLAGMERQNWLDWWRATGNLVFSTLPWHMGGGLSLTPPSSLQTPASNRDVGVQTRADQDETIQLQPSPLPTEFDSPTEGLLADLSRENRGVPASRYKADSAKTGTTSDKEKPGNCIKKAKDKATSQDMSRVRTQINNRDVGKAKDGRSKKCMEKVTSAEILDGNEKNKEAKKLAYGKEQVNKTNDRQIVEEVKEAKECKKSEAIKEITDDVQNAKEIQNIKAKKNMRISKISKASGGVQKAKKQAICKRAKRCASLETAVDFIANWSRAKRPRLSYKLKPHEVLMCQTVKAKGKKRENGVLKSPKAAKTPNSEPASNPQQRMTDLQSNEGAHQTQEEENTCVKPMKLSYDKIACVRQKMFAQATVFSKNSATAEEVVQKPHKFMTTSYSDQRPETTKDKHSNPYEKPICKHELAGMTNMDPTLPRSEVPDTSRPSICGLRLLSPTVGESPEKDAWQKISQQKTDFAQHAIIQPKNFPMKFTARSGEEPQTKLLANVETANPFISDFSFEPPNFYVGTDDEDNAECLSLNISQEPIENSKNPVTAEDTPMKTSPVSVGRLSTTPLSASLKESAAWGNSSDDDDADNSIEDNMSVNSSDDDRLVIVQPSEDKSEVADEPSYLRSLKSLPQQHEHREEYSQVILPCETKLCLSGFAPEGEVEEEERVTNQISNETNETGPRHSSGFESISTQNANTQKHVTHSYELRTRPSVTQRTLVSYADCDAVPKDEVFETHSPAKKPKEAKDESSSVIFYEEVGPPTKRARIELPLRRFDSQQGINSTEIDLQNAGPSASNGHEHTNLGRKIICEQNENARCKEVHLELFGSDSDDEAEENVDLTRANETNSANVLGCTENTTTSQPKAPEGNGFIFPILSSSDTDDEIQEIPAENTLENYGTAEEAEPNVPSPNPTGYRHLVSEPNAGSAKANLANTSSAALSKLNNNNACNFRSGQPVTGEQTPIAAINPDLAPLNANLALNTPHKRSKRMQRTITAMRRKHMHLNGDTSDFLKETIVCHVTQPKAAPRSAFKPPCNRVLKRKVEDFFNSPTSFQNAFQAMAFYTHLKEITFSEDGALKAFVCFVQDLPPLKTEFQFQQPDIVRDVRARLLFFLQHVLQNAVPNLAAKVMSIIENKLFVHANNNPRPTPDQSISLTQFYMLMVATDFFGASAPNPSRIFIAKCLYHNPPNVVGPLIYEVLSFFPTVLPWSHDRAYIPGDDALVTVLQHVLMFNAYSMEDEKLKHLLSRLRYCYHYQPFKPTYDEVLATCLAKLREGKTENLTLAFAVLCRRMRFQRTEADVIRGKLLPLADEYHERALENAEYDERIALLLEIMSTLLKPLPVETDVTSYLAVFKSFLRVTKRAVVEEAAVQAILRLQSFGYVNCFMALKDFSPTYELRAETRAALRTFFQRQPNLFWNKMVTQSKAGAGYKEIESFHDTRGSL